MNVNVHMKSSIKLCGKLYIQYEGCVKYGVVKKDGLYMDITIIFLRGRLQKVV